VDAELAFQDDLIVPLLSSDQLRQFAQRGYLVIPGAVPAALIRAALARIDTLMENEPPPAGHQGFHFYWLSDLPDADPLPALLLTSGALQSAAGLVAPLDLAKPRQLQVSLNIPVWNHRPGGPHIDGLTPPEPSGRPGTFTMLAGVFLTDQMAEDMGNLCVWPGSHHTAASYLQQHGPDAIFDIAHPTFDTAAPEQVKGRAGDLLLAHYLLGHNMGGNLSALTRRVVYFRLQAKGHRSRWRNCVRDPLFEFAAVREALETDRGRWTITRRSRRSRAGAARDRRRL
jgi:hypothetical protein